MKQFLTLLIYTEYNPEQADVKVACPKWQKIFPKQNSEPCSFDDKPSIDPFAIIHSGRCGAHYSLDFELDL